jgi:transforming growth factor-beta-induced protein
MWFLARRDELMPQGFDLMTPFPLLRRGIALLATTAVLAACGNDDAVSPTDRPTIAALAGDTPQLSTLNSALGAADLTAALDGGGPFTVFAPVNEAFGNLPTGTLETLLETGNRETLITLLQYHVVPGTFRVADLTNGQQLTTLSGDTLRVSVDGTTVRVDGVLLNTADIDASNGIVHLMAGVLTQALDLVTLAELTPALSDLLGALDAARLRETLRGNAGGAGYTVFAPSNTAFDALADPLPTDSAALTPILQQHVVLTRVLAGSLTDGQQLTTLAGVRLTVERDGSTVRLVGPSNSVQVTQPDLRGSNGIIHVIDGVLLP